MNESASLAWQHVGWSVWADEPDCSGIAGRMVYGKSLEDIGQDDRATGTAAPSGGRAIADRPSHRWTSVTPAETTGDDRIAPRFAKIDASHEVQLTSIPGQRTESGASVS